MGFIQLRGNLTVGPATTGAPSFDVADWVSEFRITSTRESVTIPATLGLEMSTAAGARSDSMTITFHSDVDAAGFWAFLYDIIETDSSEMKFAGNFNDGVTSADNPEFSGTVVLLSLDSGNTVGALRQQTLTMPVVAGTLTESTSPS